MIPLQTAPAGLPSRSFGGPRRRMAASTSRLGSVLSAPHRIGFFGGALMLGLSALWWGAMLVARFAGLALPWALAPGTAHALLMGLGFVPMFFAGFLFTAGPRWLQVPALPARAVAPGIGLMLVGWALALPGFHWSAPLAGLGLGAVCGGWMLLTAQFALLLAASPVADRDHARVIAVALGVGAAATWVAAVAVTLRADAVARAAVWAALWGSTGVVFVAAAHRLIPFLGSAAGPGEAAWRPRAVLVALVALVGIQAPFSASAALGPLAPALSFIRAAIDGLGALLLFWLSVRWGLRQSLSIRLLAMLHMGFFWLAVAFALDGVSQALQVASDGTLSLGLAPVHAFTMGFVGSLLLAMVTRVVAAQAGRAIAVDRFAWVLFWVMQLGVLARLAAALWPLAGTHLTLLAAHCWLAAVGAWALRTGHAMGRG